MGTNPNHPDPFNRSNEGLRDPYPAEDEIAQLAHDMFFERDRRHPCYSACYREAEDILLERAAARTVRSLARRRDGSA